VPVIFSLAFAARVLKIFSPVFVSTETAMFFSKSLGFYSPINKTAIDPQVNSRSLIIA
jgi:hypothetical protein